MNVRFGELQARDPIAVAAGVPGLIDSVGTEEFQDHLVGYLHELSGINQCGVYQYRDSQLLGRGAGSVNRSAAAQHQELFISSGYWQHDERIATTRRLLDTSRLGLFRVGVAEIEDGELLRSYWTNPSVRERLFLCAGMPDNAFILSLCPGDEGSFTNQDIERVGAAAPTIISALRKHAAISWTVPRVTSAVTKLSDVEACLVGTAARFPRRETQVCARLIYGMTTTGIALELGIGEGSVMTYRKRIYERLHIASQRELLIWYLGVWEDRSRGALDACLASAS